MADTQHSAQRTSEQSSHGSSSSSLFRPIVAILRDNKSPSPVILALSTLQKVDFRQDVNIQGFLDVHGVPCVVRLLQQQNGQSGSDNVSIEALKLLTRVCRHPDALKAMADSHCCTQILPLAASAIGQSQPPFALAAAAASVLAVTAQNPACAADIIAACGNTGIQRLLNALHTRGTSRTPIGAAFAEAVTTAISFSCISSKARAVVVTDLPTLTKLLQFACTTAQGKNCQLNQPDSLDGCPLFGTHPAGLAAGCARALAVCARDPAHRKTVAAAVPATLVTQICRVFVSQLALPGTLPPGVAEGSAAAGAILASTAYQNAVATDAPISMAQLIRSIAIDRSIARELAVAGAASQVAELLNMQLSQPVTVSILEAIFQLAMPYPNVKQLTGAAPALVRLAQSAEPSVQCAALAAIWALANTNSGRLACKAAGAPAACLNYAQKASDSGCTDRTTMLWACRALAQLCVDADIANQMSSLQTLQQLWSLLSDDDDEIVAPTEMVLSAALASPSVAQTASVELVGGLELIARLVTSESNEVCCGAAAMIARFSVVENAAATLTEYHAVESLAALMRRPFCPLLAKHVAQAITALCRLGANRATFGSLGVAPALVNCLLQAQGIEKSERQNSEQALLGSGAASEEPTTASGVDRGARVDDQGYTIPPAYVSLSDLRGAVTGAIRELVQLDANALLFRDCGVAKPLLELVGASDPTLQESAAEAIQSIRRCYVKHTAAATSSVTLSSTQALRATTAGLQ